MEKELKYKVIKTKEQYFEYCSLLESLVLENDVTKQDEIDLLEVLIDTWDNENDIFDAYDPIQLLEALMVENNMKQIDLANEIGIGESYLSEILSYKKGLSKKIIQKLSDAFGIRKDAFSKPYDLKRTSRISQLAAGVNYLIQGNEADDSAFVFGEPELKYEKPKEKTTQSKRAKDQ